MSEKNRMQALKELERLIKRWKRPMGLDEWEIKAIAADKNYPNDEAGISTFASTTADPVYINATITIYPSWWGQDSKKREADIIHELAHCLTQEAWDALANQRGTRFYGHIDQREIMERLTTRIANVAIRNKI